MMPSLHFDLSEKKCPRYSMHPCKGVCDIAAPSEVVYLFLSALLYPSPMQQASATVKSVFKVDALSYCLSFSV